MNNIFMQNAIYLTIHILFALGMFISLKFINTKGLNKYKAIAINYGIAAIATITDLAVSGSDWDYSLSLLLPSVVVGTLFMTSFVVMSFSTEKVGIGLTTALNKMSVVIPVMVGVLFLNQHSGILEKIIGIILALISFFLVLYKRSQKGGKGVFLLPVLVFVLSGMIDTSMELTNTFFIKSPGQSELFLLGVFIIAALMSALMQIKDNRDRLEKKIHNNEPKFRVTFFYGSLLGIFNFLTSKMILVNVGLMGGTVVFPIHNASVVLLTAIIGVLFFKESFTKKQWIGVVLAVAAVSIIAQTI